MIKRSKEEQAALIQQIENEKKLSREPMLDKINGIAALESELSNSGKAPVRTQPDGFVFKAMVERDLREKERHMKADFVSGTCLMGDQAVKASYDSFVDALDEERARHAQGKPDFVAIGTKIGELVKEKNEAYGDSFAKAAKILEVLFPDGVPVSQYTDMLGLIRVIDKQFRIANRKDAFGESPWGDIAGYGVLGVANDEQCKPTKEGA